MWKKFSQLDHFLDRHWFLLLLFTLTIILRLPSLSSIYWLHNSPVMVHSLSSAIFMMLLMLVAVGVIYWQGRKLLKDKSQIKINLVCTLFILISSLLTMSVFKQHYHDYQFRHFNNKVAASTQHLNQLVATNVQVSSLIQSLEPKSIVYLNSYSLIYSCSLEEDKVKLTLENIVEDNNLVQSLYNQHPDLIFINQTNQHVSNQLSGFLMHNYAANHSFGELTVYQRLSDSNQKK